MVEHKNQWKVGLLFCMEIRGVAVVISLAQAHALLVVGCESSCGSLARIEGSGLSWGSC